MPATETKSDMGKKVLEQTAVTLNEVIKQDSGKVAEIAEACLETYKKDGQFIFMGNGGSAANASHFSADFSKRPRWKIEGAKPICTRALTDSSESLTMWANDSGYDEVFLQQMMACRVSGNDLVFAFSGSGNSPNVLKAVTYAQEQGAKVVAITGFTGGKLADVADINITVPQGPLAQLDTDFNGAVMGEYEAVTDVIMHAVIEAFRETVKTTV